MRELGPTVPLVNGPSVMSPISTRSQSRSPVNLRRKRTEKEIAVEFLGRKIAKYFDGDIFFGTVSGRVRGHIVATEPSNRTRLLQAV